MLQTLISILDTHPDFIFRCDHALTVTYANKAAATFFREPQEKVIGSNLLDLSEPKHRNAIRSQLESISVDQPKTITTQAIERSEGTLYIHWTNIGLFDDAGDLLSYQTSGRDVTKEVILQQRLQEQSKRLDIMQVELRSVFDTVPALIWYKDDKNNILRVNKAAADSMGMRVEDIEGKNTYELFGEAASDYHEADLKVFKSGEAIHGIIEPFNPAKGEQGWVQTDKIPFTDGDDGPRILVVATDITELKEQEAILKSINKNLDDFASLTSHDLQAPLRKIGITAELMQMELEGSLPPEAEAYFEDIAQAVQHMRQLIQGFLKFMRASPEGVDLDSLELSALLQRVAQDEHENLHAIGGTLSLPEGPIYVRGDDALLQQVFFNLISNAIKYRSQDRPIDIEITAEVEKQNWVISVYDNGAGIDSSFAEQVFDLFGRAKPHSNIEGSGVGLALCRRIITLHGGTIELIKTEDLGSCFQIKLFRARSLDNG